ncbi:hypothetical protein [Bacillus sp. FJAT-45350]|uniref:hypothetical protein n=1 Tax=Bacillus sp. FJAT-45350 TaxID=2011014 RepID=UPI000BB98CDC|nr:hypothetical protein [Bacillus sp. FJAT-45350]
MKRRLKHSIVFQFPTKANLTIKEINGVLINHSKKKEVQVHNISLEELCFSTNLEFPSIDEKSLILKLKLLPQVKVIGEIISKEKKSESNYYYRLKFLTCNLGFYRHFYQLQSQGNFANLL